MHNPNFTSSQRAFTNAFSKPFFLILSLCNKHNGYTQILKKNITENAMEERVNGILKDEFYLDHAFISIIYEKRATKNSVHLHNEIRLHLSLDFKTSNMVYKLTA